MIPAPAMDRFEKEYADFLENNKRILENDSIDMEPLLYLGL